MKSNKKNASMAGFQDQGESIMEYVLDAYCGVYCGACPAMLSTRAGKIDVDKQCYGCKSRKAHRVLRHLRHQDLCPIQRL